MMLMTDARRSVDGLYPVDNSGLAWAEAKEDADVASYTAFMLGPVQVAYQKEPRSGAAAEAEGNYALEPDQMEMLQETFRDEIVLALTHDGAYELVEAPGPEVMRLDAYLIDLIVRFDRESAAGRDRAFTSSYGEVTMYLEMHDSESGEILARVAERRDPTRSSYQLVEVQPTFVRSDVMSMFRDWAGALREALDTARAARLGQTGTGGEGASAN